MKDNDKIKTSNKQIAKNTMFLYLRMLILLIVGLYTSRIVLKQLGFEDFGLYNVVGSLVMLLSFVQGSLSSSASRFLSYEIGKGSEKTLNRVFCMIMNNHMLIALILLLICETLGLWYVASKMVIPSERMNAAQIVYQLSTFSAILSLLVVPYRALIISQERMKAFASLSIVEAIAKLIIVFLLSISSFDKLVLYGFLLLVVQIIISCLYVIYCRKQFNESKWHFYWDSNLFKQMFAFTGWSICSYAPAVVDQSFNLLLNLFFGPVVNAARAVSYQVHTQIVQLVTNFQVALNPQIVKNYAISDNDRLNDLIVLSSKVSFSLLYIIALPLIASVDYVLHLWLSEVPEYSTQFISIITISSILSSFSNPLGVVAEAANRLKYYNLVVSPFYLLVVPISYFLLKSGAPAYSIFILMLLFELGAFYIKMSVVKHIYPHLLKNEYSLFLKCLISILMGLTIVFMLRTLFNDDFWGFVFKSVLTVTFGLGWIYITILDSTEKNKLMQFLINNMK